MRAAQALAALFLAVVVPGCITSPVAQSPLGRQRLLLYPDAEVAQAGVASFEKMKHEQPVDRDPVLEARVRCVADAITAQLPGGSRGWEVVVFQADEPNAFALPGRKIGVNSGIFSVARNPDQLATVLGHEVAHVVAQHANERISTEVATQSLLGMLAGGSGPEQQQLQALLGLGAQVGLLMPWSRDQEREADLMGLDLMADAGFDPRQSLELWRNMSEVGAAQPAGFLSFLSTHPANDTRMQDLSARMPEALARADAAHARGRLPRCGDR